MDIYIEGPYLPSQFMKMFMGNSSNKPLYGNVKNVKEAVAFIKSFPSFYKINT